MVHALIAKTTIPERIGIEVSHKTNSPERAADA